jgi:fumarate hydratase class II
MAQYALQHDSSLREAALALGDVSAAQFDEWVDPRRMLAPFTETGDPA